MAKETIETEEFDAMFADLPDPRKDAGSSGGITSLPLHQREEPPAEPRVDARSPTRHRSPPDRLTTGGSAATMTLILTARRTCAGRCAVHLEEDAR